MQDAGLAGVLFGLFGLAQGCLAGRKPASLFPELLAEALVYMPGHFGVRQLSKEGCYTAVRLEVDSPLDYLEVDSHFVHLDSRPDREMSAIID